MRQNTRLTQSLILAFAVIGVVSGGITACAQEAAPQKAILVTGASTGIGRNITETLAANGHYVYAGARKEEDLLALNAIDNVQSIRTRSSP